MNVLALSLVSSAAFGVWLVLAYVMRNVTFEGMGTDQEVQTKAAAQAGRWKWPSDMHQYLPLTSRMKDMGVLLLVFVQRALRDRTGCYPLVLMGAFVHSVTGVLVFLAGSSYWGTGIGVLISLLYLGSIWSYLIVLNGAFQGLAMMFLVLCVYMLQLGSGANLTTAIPFYAASGAAFTAVLFSSASSRKFIPLGLGAFVFSLRGLGGPLGFGSLVPSGSVDWALLIASVLMCGGLLIGGSALTIYLASQGSRWGRWIDSLGNGLMSSRYPRWKEFLQAAAKPRHLIRLGVLVFSVVAFLCVLSLVFGSVGFYARLLAALFGLSLLGLVLLLPAVLKNMAGYYSYYIMHQYTGHMPMYDDYFKKILGHTVHEGDGGVRWYVGYARRILPFHSIFILASVAFLIYYGVTQATGQVAGGMVVVVLLAAAPNLWSEVTRGPKATLPYFPAFTGVLLLIGFGMFYALESLEPRAEIWFWVASAVLAVLSAIWTVWHFFRDVRPARMAPLWLAHKLDSLGAEGFYTYETPFNGGLVDVLINDDRYEYEIKYIQTLNDATDGYVVVPCTSAKATNMEGSRLAIEHGDFDQDPELTRLIAEREIGNYAVASFKTFGTSRMWVHQYHVPSYRDLVLHEIGEEDLWRGRAWILDVGKLHAARHVE